MPISCRSYILTAAALLIPLAGCSSSGSRGDLTPTGGLSSLETQPGAAFRAAQGDAKAPGGLYIGEFDAGTVAEYSVPDKKNLGPRCSDIPDRYSGVAGIAVDAHRLLYVPYNDNATHDVATFGPNCGTRGPTLVDPYGDVGSVAIDNKKNTVYVGNENTGNIEVYANGATTPTGELNLYHGSGFGLAVNGSGDVFDSGNPIIEFPHGQNNRGKQLSLSGLQGPIGLSFDRDDNLLVSNEYNIAIYAPPYNGAPKQTITTQPFCLYSAVDAKNEHLYVSEQTNNAVDVYAYPSGKFEYSITAGIQSRSVDGVALDPPSKT
jgi:hypothetical protein